MGTPSEWGDAPRLSPRTREPAADNRPSFVAGPLVRLDDDEPGESPAFAAPAEKVRSEGIGGWFRHLWARAVRIFFEVDKDDCTGLASEIAYSFMLSLFPSLLFIVSLLSLLGSSPERFNSIMEVVHQAVPPELLQVVDGYVTNLLQSPSVGVLTVSIIATMWTSSTGAAALIKALDRAYGVEKGRSFIRTRLLALSLVVSGGVALIVSFNLFVFGAGIAEWLVRKFDWTDLLPRWLSVLRWPITFFVLMFFAAVVYYVVPRVRQKFIWVLPGAVFFSLTWLAVTYGFSAYINRFDSYNKTYGSIGAAIALMFWMYLTALILLIGGEVNSDIHRERIRVRTLRSSGGWWSLRRWQVRSRRLQTNLQRLSDRLTD